MECEFCNELNGKNNFYSELAKKHGLPIKRIIYEGEHWVVCPTIGAIVQGYVLIISKKHRLSLMACNKEEIVELEYLLKKIRNTLERIYHYPCIAFEHGSGDDTDNKPSSIEHCHLHVLPLKENIYHRIEVEKFKVFQIGSLLSLCESKGKQVSYLLYQDQKERIFTIYTDKYISQYFRQLIAVSEGVAEKWNWKYYYFLENIKTTIDDIQSELSR